MWTLYTANKEHWVSIATVASFKRMREFSANGMDWVVSAVKLSEELEVDETDEKVRRRTEVQEPKGQFERSIYAVRIPVFYSFSLSKLNAARKASERRGKVFRRILKTFSISMEGSMLYGCVENMKLSNSRCVRYADMGLHKLMYTQGSVFVEFADMSSVTRFLESDPKPTWDEKELLIMSKYVKSRLLTYRKFLKRASIQRRLLRDEDQGEGSKRESGSDKTAEQQRQLRSRIQCLP